MKVQSFYVLSTVYIFLIFLTWILPLTLGAVFRLSTSRLSRPYDSLEAQAYETPQGVNDMEDQRIAVEQISWKILVNSLKWKYFTVNVF